MAEHQHDQSRTDQTETETERVFVVETVETVGTIATVIATCNPTPVQVPAETPPPSPGAITTEFDPAIVHYDEDRAISYQFRQLEMPGDSTLASKAWKDIFLPIKTASPFKTDPPEPKVYIASLVNLPRIGRLNRVLTWSFEKSAIDRGTYVDFDEYGYDQSGYPCLISGAELGRRRSNQPRPETARGYVPRRQIDESLFKRAENSPSPAFPWARQRFGREWIFGVNGSHDEGVLAFVVLQFCRDEDFSEAPGSYDPSNMARRKFAQRFLAYFAGCWEPSRYPWRSSDDRWTGLARFNKSWWEDLLFQFHMRVFTTQTRPWPNNPGHALVRDWGTLLVPGEKNDLDLRELRFSVAMKATWKMNLPIFTMVIIADKSAASRFQDLGDLGDADKWMAANIRPSLRLAGVAAFAFRIRSLLTVWEASWSDLLQGIERVLTTELASVLSPSARGASMFVENNLQLAEFYFSVLQILRIAASWIQESMDDLGRTVDHIEWLCYDSSPAGASSDSTLNYDQDPTVEVFRQNWESVKTHHRRLGDALLKRIEKKQEQVKGLQDGLFNAISVNEATKTTQLNHFILVFTIVTVFYLPLSFVTGFFDAGLFDWSYLGKTSSFAATIVSVAGLTYLLSGFSIWIIQDPGLRDSFRSGWMTLKNFLAGLRRRVSFGRHRRKSSEDTEQPEKVD
ncbi:hypothetical protein B0T14DRAFT_566335 [Immersiella caudata]|uniref:Uncharacterized protein n=1 Tax=Immersiella caudata TaxID=314043 RepID=A0AA40BZS8_9PEZI|nr:hypothetical protein B0T14DRAFT_566335 [Immersiella caudata]